jgi:capsular polysaccharide biosynthesis protein
VNDPMLSRPPASTTRAPDPEPAAREREGVGLRGMVAVLRRWRTMLVAAALAAGVCGYVVADRASPTYETSAVMLVGPINADLDTLRAAGQLAQTYAQLATSRPLVSATGRRLGLSGVGGGISASANQVTRLLTIKVRDHDPARGARIANAHADELVSLATRRRSVGAGELHIVEAAQAAGSPSGPGPVPLALVAAAAGFLVALGVAALVDGFGATVHGVDDLGGLTSAGCVGALGRRAWRAAKAPTPVVERAPSSRAAGEYRLLAGRLHAIGERSLLVLDVEGAGPGVTANLGAAFGASGAHAAILDADAPELADVVSADDARQLLEGLLVGADVVIVHAPAIERSPGALLWARVVDGTLLVARVDRTPRRDLAVTADNLRMVHARLLGTILGPPPGLLGR